MFSAFLKFSSLNNLIWTTDILFSMSDSHFSSGFGLGLFFVTLEVNASGTRLSILLSDIFDIDVSSWFA